MHITYTPAPCKVEDSKFKGEVVLKVPAYEERLEMLADHPEILESAEESSSKKNKKVSGKDLKVMLAMIKWSYKFYHKVDITRKRDGARIESLDGLRYDKDCQDIIQDIATRLSQGFDLGEV